MFIRERDEAHVEICTNTVTDARLRAYLVHAAKRKRQTGPWVSLTVREWGKRPGVNGVTERLFAPKPFRDNALGEIEERLQARRRRILGIRG